MALEARPLPQILLCVAVYEPSVETMILNPVSPVDQFRVQFGQEFSAMRTTDSPGQIAVGPDADIVAIAGTASGVTFTALEIGLSPQALLVMAV